MVGRPPILVEVRRFLGNFFGQFFVGQVWGFFALDQESFGATRAIVSFCSFPVVSFGGWFGLCQVGGLSALVYVSGVR